MKCPHCGSGLKKPTPKEINFSLSIHYAQTTHVCKNCGIYWVILEQTIPIAQQKVRKGLEAFL